MVYVKTNNYIRKIDELGRIVIPKEVRHKLKIQENENIMITSDDSKILISKYSYLENYYNYIKSIAEYINEIYKYGIEITDRNKTIISISPSNHFIENEIIMNSIKIGKVKMYIDNNDENQKFLKLISRIISSYFDYS